MWWPKSGMIESEDLDNGTTVIQVKDWIYDQNMGKAEPGNFQEPPEKHPELPLDLNEETIHNRDIRTMSDADLLVHFDEVLAIIHNRGLDLDVHYGEQKDDQPD